MPNFLQCVNPLEKDRDQLNALVTAFVSNGGQIKKCPANARTRNDN